MTNKREYSRGYQAGRKFRELEIGELREELRQRVNVNQEERSERAYFNCLDIVLKHCSGWRVGGEEIKNAEGYCDLARIFAKNSISRID